MLRRRLWVEKHTPERYDISMIYRNTLHVSVNHHAHYLPEQYHFQTAPEIRQVKSILISITKFLHHWLCNTFFKIYFLFTHTVYIKNIKHKFIHKIKLYVNYSTYLPYCQRSIFFITGKKQEKNPARPKCSPLQSHYIPQSLVCLSPCWHT